MRSRAERIKGHAGHADLHGESDDSVPETSGNSPSIPVGYGVLGDVEHGAQSPGSTESQDDVSVVHDPTIGRTVLTVKDNLSFDAQSNRPYRADMKTPSGDLPVSAVQIQIGARMRAVRKAHRLTQMDVSRAIGVDQSQYSRWERGEEAPGLLRIMEFADRLRCSVEFLCFGIPVRVHPDVLVKVSKAAVANPAIVILPTDTAWSTDTVPEPGRGR